MRGKGTAGAGCGLGAPKDGNYDSSSRAFSTSVLLAHCPLHGFVGSRSKSKGRTFQQKFRINKDLLPPAEVQRGCGGALATPPCLRTMTFSLRDVHLSSHFAKPWSPMLISFGRAPAPGVTSAAAGPTDGSNSKLPILGKDWPGLWKL